MKTGALKRAAWAKAQKQAAIRNALGKIGRWLNYQENTDEKKL
jgi:hypothetical protein